MRWIWLALVGTGWLAAQASGPLRVMPWVSVAQDDSAKSEKKNESKPEQKSDPAIAERKFTAQEMKAIVDEKSAFLLDVREPAELDDMGAVAGYVNIPLGDLEKRMSEIPKDRPVVAICRRGVRASRAAATLKKNGYTIDGVFGMADWVEAKYPVVRPKDKPQP